MTRFELPADYDAWKTRSDREMDQQDEQPKVWTDGWIEGFAAAVALLSDNYDFYEQRRDEYFAAKDGEPAIANERNPI